LSTLELVEEYSWAGLLRTLSDFGYGRVDKVTRKTEYSVKGDTISFWQPGFENPFRLEYWGDELDQISLYDPLTGEKRKKFKNLPVFNLRKLFDESDYENISFTTKNDTFSDEASVLLPLLEDFKEVSAADTNQFDFTQVQLYFNKLDLLEKDLNKLENEGFDIKIITKHKNEIPNSLKKFLKTQLPDKIPLRDIEQVELGFHSDRYKLHVITDRELFGTIFVTSRKSKKLKSTQAQKLLTQLEGEIEIDDFIVHEDYGVGIYRGFVIEDNKDYLKIEYAENDELFVPLEQIDKLTKYIGEKGQSPNITRLGKTDWSTIKRKVKRAVAITAKELARHYALTKLATASKIDPISSEGYKSFVEDFEYEPTSDQVKAEREIIEDMSQEKTMNRLLIGDVGYGKTEVMMRAIYKVVESGKQAVVLCPTTVLSLQHFNTFNKRFRNTVFKDEICILSRHNSALENKKILEKIKDNEYKIIIGTHRILSNDFQAKNMGLLVIDEEQRFGVKQKEKIKKLEYGVHTLYVSATPIPRTLSMALSSIKDISMINTPPSGRKSIKTQVSRVNWQRIVNAINFEIERGGQVFFVHNRVKTIPSIKAKLQKLLPGVNFVIAHGQMSPEKLDKIMTQFYEGKYDCLIATTIIENGLDMPNVNTIIVDNAQNLGLAQMYQLRGRVGRSKKQAFAYFFYKGEKLPGRDEIEEEKSGSQDLAIKPNGKKKKHTKYLDRLEAILSAQSLGSGFLIASRDLEIRGAGNLLGREQHGNISKIGYGLYIQLLAEEIERLKKAD
jgi:transcription-repair coupling factor (superfamily II helicase)